MTAKKNTQKAKFERTATLLARAAVGIAIIGYAAPAIGLYTGLFTDTWEISADLVFSTAAALILILAAREYKTLSVED